MQQHIASVGLVLFLALAPACVNAPGRSNESDATLAVSSDIDRGSPARDGYERAAITTKPVVVGATAESSTTATTTDEPSVSVHATANEAGAKAADAKAADVQPHAEPQAAPPAAAITVTAEMPREARRGKPFEYRLVVTNTGASAASDVVLVETMGEGLSFASSEPEGRVAEGGAVEGSATEGAGVEFHLGAIPAGESRTVLVHADVTGEAHGVVARHSTVDVRLSESTTLPVTAPVLALATAFASADVSLCDDVAGHFTVSNTGTGRAEHVRVRATLPEGLTTIDGKKEFDASVEDLDGGRSRDVAFAWRAQNTGAFTASATATAEGDLSVTSTPVAIVVRQPKLALKVDGPSEPLTVGRTGTYTFVVQNTGDAPATDMQLVATIPTSLELTVADAGGARVGERVTWNLGTLAPNESRTCSATCRGKSSSAMTVRATTTARCAAEVRAAFGTEVRGAPDLRVRLTDVAGAVAIGTPQEYVCELSNLGQVDLTNVRVAAAWPPQVEWVDSPFRPEAAVAGERAEFQLDTLAVGEKKRFTFRLRAVSVGQFKINSTTTCAEMSTPVSQDEVTTFVER